jgi:outer membrane immunogenic protein
MFRSRGTLLALTALGAGVLISAPVRAEPKDFSGPYVGLEADYLWGNVRPSGFAGAGDAPIPSSHSSAALGALTVGYDWQTSGNLVLGLYASAALGNVRQNSTSTRLTVNGGEGVTIQNHGFSTNLTTLAQLGARAGLAVNKNVLIYAKGAVAMGVFHIEETGDNAGAYKVKWPVGYTAGVGVDFRLSKNWVAGLSWEHVDLGSADFIPAAYGPGRVGFRGEAGKLGLRFQF